MKKIIRKLIVFSLPVIFPLFIVVCVGAAATYQSQIVTIKGGYEKQQEEKKTTYTGITLTVSSSVEKYRMAVEEQAKLNGISDYTNLLLAIMMQESGGLVQDVFQCSESLGKKPNTITTQESIVQGVRFFAQLLQQAGVTSNTDIEHIRLALQAYNFGNSFIPFAIGMDSGWSQNATNKFAEIHSKGIKRTGQKAAMLGIWQYGDQYYTDHVLRYYSLVLGTNSDIVEYAKTLLGCPYKYGATGPDEFDCSGLVYYVFKQTKSYTGERTTAAGYSKIATPVKENEAIAGDLVFFTNASGVHHVGIYIGNGQMIHAPQTGDVVKIAAVKREKETVTFGRLAKEVTSEEEDNNVEQ